ncbi:MAG: hypothetical protein ACRDA8_13440 [Shewanella sp.]
MSFIAPITPKKTKSSIFQPSAQRLNPNGDNRAVKPARLPRKRKAATKVKVPVKEKAPAHGKGWIVGFLGKIYSRAHQIPKA